MTKIDKTGDAVSALELLQKRAYSHAEKSNGPKEMREWIDSDVEKIRAALSSTAQQGWEDISSAPRDGTPIIAWNGNTKYPTLTQFKYGAWRKPHYGGPEPYWYYADLIMWHPIILPSSPRVPDAEGGV